VYGLRGTLGATEHRRPVHALRAHGGAPVMTRNVYVYLSGPLTAFGAYSLEENIASAVAVFLACIRRGIPAFCPHLSAAFPSAHAGIPYDTWMAYDLATLDRCTALLMLPRWQTSPGALLEKTYAETRGLPIFYALDDLLVELTPRPAGELQR
jgi:hypothetical protein